MGFPPSLIHRFAFDFDIHAADPVDFALISISMVQIQWRRGGADLGMIWRLGLQDGSLWRRGRTSRSRDLALIR
jgi:hypothetical protein